jgi:hypothetical protein
MSDFIEIGDSGLVPAKDGWFWDKHREVYVDPDGDVRSIKEYENHETSHEG